MLRFFQSKKISMLILVPLLVTGFLLNSFFFQENINTITEYDSFLEQFLFSWLHSFSNKVVLLIISVFLVTVFVYLSIFFANRFNILLSNNFLYGFLLLFILNVTLYNPYLTEALFVGALIIGAFAALRVAYNKEITTFDYFNASTMIASAALINHKFIFFTLLVPAAYIVNGQGSNKDIIASIFGFITPLYFLYGFHYFFTGNFVISPVPFSDIAEINRLHLELSIKEIVALLFSLIIGIYGLFYIFSNTTSLNLAHKSSFKLLFFGFIILLAIIVIYPTEIFFMMPVAAFLIAIPQAFYFNRSKRKVLNEIIFDLLLLLLIIVHIPFFNFQIS